MAIVAIITAALACGVLYAIVGRGGSGHNAQSVNATPSVPASATPDAARAAAWVLDSVGPADVVACDVTVCAVLRAHDFPAPSMITIAARSSLTTVEQADVVVLTPVLRAQLGAGVNAIVSAEPLASFGSGRDRVEVTAVALQGAGAYASALASDRANRRQAGAALLSNSKIIADSAARNLLADGSVDTRVCALLAILAGEHNITLAGFTPVAPGAGADLPTTGVIIEDVDTRPAAGQSPPAAALLALVRAQQAPYIPMTIGAAQFGGNTGLRIVFSQPGPLGLLGTTGP